MQTTVPSDVKIKRLKVLVDQNETSLKILAQKQEGLNNKISEIEVTLDGIKTKVEDVKTSYLHIAYANSADGKIGFSVSDSVGKLYIGQYTDFVKADSTDPTKYSWTKIKGETGANGKPGEDGLDSVLLQIFSSNGTSFKNSSVATTLTVTIFVGGEEITSYQEMIKKFGNNAVITWEEKKFGQEEFVPLDPNDNRITDNGFILTLTVNDVRTQTVFNCKLDY